VVACFYERGTPVRPESVITPRSFASRPGFISHLVDRFCRRHISNFPLRSALGPAHKKTPIPPWTPYDPRHRPTEGPRGLLFLMSEVPLCTLVDLSAPKRLQVSPPGGLTWTTESIQVTPMSYCVFPPLLSSTPPLLSYNPPTGGV
jgi:hypothetical protein